MVSSVAGLFGSKPTPPKCEPSPPLGERTSPPVWSRIKEGGTEEGTQKSERQGTYKTRQKEPLLKDSPLTKANKDTGPRGRTFSPALKQVQKAVTKSEETLLFEEAAPIKKKAGGFYDSPSLGGTVPSPLLSTDTILGLWYTNGIPLAVRLLYRHSAAFQSPLRHILVENS